ncbi:hypothetical protein TNCV_2861541 [Trichonephila clavipes]|nr:hypothetical protein TNCV_2861541 [Trichonephila clavipes]
MIWTTRFALALLGVLCILNSFVLGKSVPASMTEDQNLLDENLCSFETTIVNEIRSLINMTVHRTYLDSQCYMFRLKLFWKKFKLLSLPEDSPSSIFGLTVSDVLNKLLWKKFNLLSSLQDSPSNIFGLSVLHVSTEVLLEEINSPLFQVLTVVLLEEPF